MTENKVIAVFGLPGTGKTYFATRFADAISAWHANTDKIRIQHNLQGKYDLQTKEKVYQLLFDFVREGMKKQKTVVIDGTFIKKDYRNELKQFCKPYQVPVHFIEIRADEEVVQQRTNKKREESEADFAVYLKLKDAFDPMEENHLILDSSREDIQEMIAKAKKYLQFPT